MEQQIAKEIPHTSKLTVDDFRIIKLIGKGSYGKVYLVQKKTNGPNSELYAMKILKKKEMFLKNQLLHTKTEKRIMETCEHPFIIKLKYSFQNNRKLYLLTSFCSGGELYYHLNRIGKFKEKDAKFYIAQIVLALEYLHSKSIVYRE